MSLFPNKNDILTKEIESWKGFADSLRKDDRNLFIKMLDDCFKYAAAINAKGEPFPTESLLMTLLLLQQKIVDSLIIKISKCNSDWTKKSIDK